jgi:DNA-directed RNA polymerase specialized sigma24 family protein
MSQEHESVSVWIQQVQEGMMNMPVEKLWKRYFHRLVILARTKLGSLPRRAADEEDVALSAFHSFCAGAAEGRFPALGDRNNLWRLLVTITARKCYQLNLSNSRLKRGGNAVLDEAALKRKDGGDGSGLGIEAFIATEPTPEFAAQAAEEYRRLLDVLEDDRSRQIAEWKMEGFTQKEIAEKLDTSERTVEREIKAIKGLWERHMDGVSDEPSTK